VGQSVIMSARLKKHMAALKQLAKATPSKRKALIAKCTPQLIDCISECALNCLNNALPMKKRHFERLKRHKKNLRLVARKSTSRKIKKKTLSQTGGFIVPLLTAVLTAIASNLITK
jgi:hypothetical protein